MADDPVDQEFEELKKRAEKQMPKYQDVTLRCFLEEIPPDKYVNLVQLTSSDGRYIAMPDIEEYCEAASCRELRLFKAEQSIYQSGSWRFEFITYKCRNCGSSQITFAIAIRLRHMASAGSDGNGTAVKIGQTPPFGPQTPARLITLIGPDREIFLQGRRAENRGMGIGAFAYYRRVVENQKNRIIAEIARVAKALGSAPEVDALFEAAMKETRFSESLEMVKDVIPQTLMISGRNPLSLLHSALSNGLHDDSMTDDRCLQLAQSIRTILAELAERAAAALKSDKDIQAALSTLLAVQSAPAAEKGIGGKNSAEVRRSDDTTKSDQ